MALKVTTGAVIAAVLLAAPAHGQSLSAEVAQTGGYSSTENGAVATQARLFGDAALGVRFNLETAWGARSGEDTDTFSAAYPYDARLHVIEAYGDRLFRPGGGLVAVRAGRFRAPFGIYSGSDYAYGGFLRAPLIRYDDNFALSNNFLEDGVSVVAGVPNLYVETAVGQPGDAREGVRPNGVDSVVRVQASYRTVILGASHISTRPVESPELAHGRTSFVGIDGRWMQSGVEVRGEWIAGSRSTARVPREGTSIFGCIAASSARSPHCCAPSDSSTTPYPHPRSQHIGTPLVGASG